MQFEVARGTKLERTRFVDADTGALADGEARLAVDLFALTTNTVTYGVHGDALKYWAFFPSGDPAWGRVPAWGVGTVIASRVAGLAEGERVYGFLGMANALTLALRPSGATGLNAVAPHRAALPTAYNRYRRWDDAMGDAAVTAILQPLHATAFLLVDFLAESAFFGAETLLFSSASSKTALAIAHAAHGREARPRLVGMTSAANAAFTRATGAYDEVLTYGELEVLTPVRAVYVDLAGDRDLRARVHGHFGALLAHSAAIGDTHMGLLGPKVEVPGPKPAFFFAPDWLAKRQADWGSGAASGRLDAAWAGFATWALAWLSVVHERGTEAVERRWAAAVAGRMAAADGVVLSL